MKEINGKYKIRLRRNAAKEIYKCATQLYAKKLELHAREEHMEVMQNKMRGEAVQEAYKLYFEVNNLLHLSIF